MCLEGRIDGSAGPFQKQLWVLQYVCWYLPVTADRDLAFLCVVAERLAAALLENRAISVVHAEIGLVTQQEGEIDLAIFDAIAAEHAVRMDIAQRLQHVGNEVRELFRCGHDPIPLVCSLIVPI